MVARNSAADDAGWPATPFEAIRHWFLERKLYRRSRADLAGVLGRIIAVRLYSATACLISMVLVARIGAFARAISAYDWHVSRTLDGATLLAASMQASRYEGLLLPVFLVWAVLLLLTPPGYTAAYRAAAITAGVLGYLHFIPPHFPVATEVAAISRWLSTAGSRAFIPYLIASIAAAWALQYSAVNTFRRLPRLRRDFRAPSSEWPSDHVTRRIVATPLVLAILLSAAWAATVIRLSAAGAVDQVSYGFQGALAQSKYLFALTLIAIIIAQITSGEKWLMFAVALTALYGLLPSTGPFHTKKNEFFLYPPALEVSAGREQLIRIGTVWGTDALWAALFIFIPAIVLGIYVVARLLRSVRDPFPR
jgi:hypothetical protein